jgi:hypothetical protein
MIPKEITFRNKKGKNEEEVTLDMVRYGHYLAAHRSYFEQKLQ